MFFKKLLKKVFGILKSGTQLDGYRFHIDVVSPEQISGWVVNDIDESVTPTVEIRSGSSLLWQAKANTPREDLQEAGLGDSAFFIKPIFLNLQTDIKSVDIFIDGRKVSSEPFPLEMIKPDNGDYQGCVDDAGVNSVRGWASLKNGDSHRVSVELRCEENVIANGVADIFREDLLKAGIGDGAYGFELSTNLASFSSETVLCQVYFDGILTDLPLVEITASQDVIDKAKFREIFSDQLFVFEEKFVQEKQRISEQISRAASGDKDVSLNMVANIALDNIAELSTRLSIIENFLVGHFAEKK